MRLYDYLPSGNGYKVRLLLSQLGQAFERVELDITQGETRTPEFLALNPNGRIPLLELDDGRRLAESNAILVYLGHGTDFWPDDPWHQAQCLHWMFFEQYNHEPNIAVARFWQQHGEMTPELKAQLPEKMERGYAALEVMEQHLIDHAFLVGDRYTVADIALYAYTHVAEEGGFQVGRFNGIRGWLSKVARQPGHVRIDDATVGAG